MQILLKIMEENIDEVFVDLVQSLGKLSKKRQEDLALTAIELVKKCLLHISKKGNLKPKSSIAEGQPLPETKTTKELEGKNLFLIYTFF